MPNKTLLRKNRQGGGCYLLTVLRQHGAPWGLHFGEPAESCSLVVAPAHSVIKCNQFQLELGSRSTLFQKVLITVEQASECLICLYYDHTSRKESLSILPQKHLESTTFLALL